MAVGMKVVDVIGLAILVGLMVRYWQGFSSDVNAVGSATSNVIGSLTRFD